MPGTRDIFRAVLLIAFLATAIWPAAQVRPASAEITERPGWVIVPTGHTYENLTQRVANAAARRKITVVSVASATVGVAAALSKKIPGNMVLGLYHPRFADRMLAASVSAGIEAPIRVYVTENPNGSATISYKKPSFVFAPYMDEGGAELKALADELDELFALLVKDASAQ